MVVDPLDKRYLAVLFGWEIGHVRQYRGLRTGYPLSKERDGVAEGQIY